ncbi:MAG TPA: DNA-processing protein DprA [Symbiobacteriaceae bacterium]
MDAALRWLTLARAKGVGRTRLARLMQFCKDAEAAWYLSARELMQIEGWNRPAAEAAVAIRQDDAAIEDAAAELERARHAGLRLVTMLDPDYPEQLRALPDCPPYYYQAGPWRPDQRPIIAVVGTRRPTAYGVSVAERFSRRLAELGAVVVSGMARGIDCAAHRGCLAAGGTTIAVLGGGADVIYPREAADIYWRIRETGAVISEQPPGTPPRSEHFPERNRIISGLAQGILVVEAGRQSGTLITVNAALSQGRDVFAVPGPIHSPMSVGPHQLIRDGAYLVTCAEEIIEVLGYGPQEDPRGSVLPDGLSPEEQQVLAWLGQEPRWAGDLAEGCGLSPGTVQGILTLLEIKGLIRQVPGGQYIRIG